MVTEHSKLSERKWHVGERKQGAVMALLKDESLGSEA